MKNPKKAKNDRSDVLNCGSNSTKLLSAKSFSTAANKITKLALFRTARDSIKKRKRNLKS